MSDKADAVFGKNGQMGLEAGFNPTQDQLSCAQEFYTILVQKLGGISGEAKVHAQTAIYGAAAMSGVLLLRSLGLPLKNIPVGQLVFTEQASIYGPRLIQTFSRALSASGVRYDLDQIVMNLPEGHNPLLSIVEVSRLVEPDFLEAMTRYGQDYRKGAYVCTLAAAIFVSKTQEVLDPSVSVALAVGAIVEGCKTFPGNLSS